MTFARSFPAAVAALCLQSCASPAAPAPRDAAPPPASEDAAVPVADVSIAAGPPVSPDAPAAVSADAPAAPSPTAPSSTPARRQWSCPPGPFPAPKAGPAQTVCGSLPLKFNWNEGPTWIAGQGAFYFSNFTIGAGSDGDIIKLTPATGKCELFVEDAGCNGLAVASDGNIVAACHKSRSIMKFDAATGAGTVVASMAEGMMLDSPNDIVVHSNGTIYFTNPTNDLAGRPPGYGSSVLRIDPAGVLSLVARGGPNGIALSPDERRLYVVFMGVFDLDEQGVPLRKAGGFALGNDGIAVDCAGNVYEHGGTIHDPGGARVGSFPGGTNMAFGGADGKLLLMVEGKGAHTVEMNLPGLP
jgi:gluconolactonase